MARVQKEIYIRFADEPMAFVYTVKYGGFTVKSARIPIAVHGPLDDASNIEEQLLRKPASDNSESAG